MNIRPIQDQIFVIPVVKDERVTESGLIVKETNKTKIFEGVVVAVGPGPRNTDGSVRKMEVSDGDKIMYEITGAQATSFEGQDYVVVRENNVVGILE